MSRRFLAVIFVTGFVLLLTAVPGEAAFPGENGRIIFLQGPNGQVPNIFSMKPDGSDERQITFFNGVGLCCEAVSPDARHIVFTEFPANAPPQLWMVNADGGNLHKVLDDPMAGDQNGSFAPDGSTLYFTRCQDSCALYRVRTDGSGLKEITPFRQDIFDFNPVASPDGRTIAFTSYNRGGILGAIYLVDTDGSHLRRLTLAEFGAQDADWSPDSSKIAFTTHCCNPQSTEVWTINADGSGLERLTHTQTLFDFTPSWAPEGNAITFYRYFPSINKSAIYVLLLSNRQETLVKEMRVANSRNAQPVRPFLPQGAAKKSWLKEIEFDAFRPKWGVAR